MRLSENTKRLLFAMVTSLVLSLAVRALGGSPAEGFGFGFLAYLIIQVAR